MAHEAADCGPALERFQDYLHLLTRLQFDPRWQGKVDLSGVVQQTLFEAQRAWEQLGTWDEARQMAWLRRALAHNLTDEVRKLGACRRGAAPERSLDQALEVAAVLAALLPPGVFHEDAAHGFRGGGEEVAAAVPVPRLLDVHQPQVRLVDQRGRLQRLAGLLLGQLLGGEPAEFVVDQGQQVLGVGRVALLDGVQDLGYVTHRPYR